MREREAMKLNSTQNYNRFHYAVNRLDSRYRTRERELTKSELRAEIERAFRNTAALPLCADGLPQNIGEGEVH